MKIFETLSRIIYSFVMDTRAGDFKYFQNGHSYGNGMEYLFIVILAVPLVFCLYFYYVQASSLANGTKRNYMVVFFLGLLTLVVLNFVVLTAVSKHPNALSSFNMWKVNLIDLVYYPVMYQIYSWFAKTGSKVPHVDLINCVFNK